jgi:membrane fusion protein
MFQSRLFRSEALAHQANRGLGHVILATSPRSTALGLAALLFAALIVAFACYGQFARKAHVSGYVTPDKGLIKVFAPSIGIVVERRVSEGQQVAEGEVLAVISGERGSLETVATRAASIGLLRQRRQSLERERVGQQEIARLKSEALENRITSLGIELEKLDASRETQSQRVQAAEQSARRFAKLETRQFVAAIQLQQVQDAALDQRSRLQALERDRVALRGELDGLASERAAQTLEAESQQASLDRAIAELDQELTEYESTRSSVVTAPAAGVVTSILIDVGQHIAPEAPLLSIIPEGAVLEAQLLVPSRAIGFVEPDQAVALRYEAFPYQRFGHHTGRVKSIARTLVSPGETTLPVALQEPVYLVTVSLESQAVKAYGRELPLQVGMLLNGDIYLDRRTVLQWVLDPIYSLTRGV